MSEKQKITHFNTQDSSKSKASAMDSPDRSHLARLYPQSKTEGEKRKDLRLFQRSFRRQLPKYPHFTIAAYGTPVLGLAVWFVQNLNAWWFSSSGNQGAVMSAVFFTFALLLLLTFFTFAWIKYVNDLLSYLGGVTAFWLVFGVSISILVVIWLSGWLWSYTNILWVPLLSLLCFIVIFFSTKYLIDRNSSGLNH